MCGVKGAGAWPAVINFTSSPDVNQIYSVHRHGDNDNFTIYFNTTASRTLHAKILDYECDTYFPEPTNSPADGLKRQYSRNAPTLLNSCTENLLLDVQCKIVYLDFVYVLKSVNKQF